MATEDMVHVLKTHFKFDDFKSSFQREAVESVLSEQGTP